MDRRESERMKRLAVGVIFALLVTGCTIAVDFIPFPVATPIAIRPLEQASSPAWSGGLAAGERRVFSFAGTARAQLRACVQTGPQTPARLEVFDSQGRLTAAVDEAAVAGQAIIIEPAGLCITFRSDATGRGYLRVTNRDVLSDQFTLFLYYP